MENFESYLKLAMIVLAACHVIFSVATSNRDKEVTSLLWAIILFTVAGV